MRINQIKPFDKSFAQLKTDKSYLNKELTYSEQPTHYARPNVINLLAYQPKISFGFSAGAFKKFAATESNPLWEKLIKRETPLYAKPNETRSEFGRDLARLIQSDAYIRMRDKAQVWALPKSATASTRLTHVDQVASVARNIAKELGLNEELAEAIARGHDVGHTPFGHDGEVTVNEIMKAEGLENHFWKGPFFHEKNSLRFIDDLETKLSSDTGGQKNLDLTYAVRDGIVSHCGEVNENAIFPRNEYLDLRTIQKGYRPQPFTWEGCVVKISDKIAYLGKDIEDSLANKTLKPDKLEKLRLQVNKNCGFNFEHLNNSILINHFITDICENSSPEKGLKFSENTLKLINTIKDFNMQEIYHPKGDLQKPYADIAIKQIYKTLDGFYNSEKTIEVISEQSEITPNLSKGFKEWLVKFSDIDTKQRIEKKYDNKIIYEINNQKDYKLAALEYISSLTDKETKNLYEEIIFRG